MTQKPVLATCKFDNVLNRLSELMFFSACIARMRNLLFLFKKLRLFLSRSFASTLLAQLALYKPTLLQSPLACISPSLLRLHFEVWPLSQLSALEYWGPKPWLFNTF